MTRLRVWALLGVVLAGCATGTGNQPPTPAPSELPRTLAVLPFVPLPDR